MAELASPNEEELRNLLKSKNLEDRRNLRSYEQLLGVDIRALASERIREKGSFVWFDMCCGKFEAGRQLVYDFQQSQEEELSQGVRARGIDLNTVYPGDHTVMGMPNVVISRGDVVDYPINEGVDLITCLQGIRYVEQYLRKGAQAVANWYNSLPLGSTLAFDYPDILRKDNEPIFPIQYPVLPIVVQGEHLPEFLKQELGESVVTKPTFDNAKGEGTTAVIVSKSDARRLEVK